MACGRPLARPTTYTIVMSADLLKIDLFGLASRLTHKDTHSGMSAYKGDWRRTCCGRFVPKLCLKMSVVAI
jgi:hypothetical protein